MWRFEEVSQALVFRANHQTVCNYIWIYSDKSRKGLGQIFGETSTNIVGIHWLEERCHPDEAEAVRLLKKLQETFDRLETNWHNGQDDCDDDNLLTELQETFEKVEKEVKKSTDGFHDFIRDIPIFDE